MSAEGMTMNTSVPPSSSTLFLMLRPAASATAAPAPTDPVRVTARMRRSSMSFDAAAPSMSSVWKAPAGKPARSNSSPR